MGIRSSGRPRRGSWLIDGVFLVRDVDDMLAIDRCQNQKNRWRGGQNFEFQMGFGKGVLSKSGPNFDISK